MIVAWMHGTAAEWPQALATVDRTCLPVGCLAFVCGVLKNMPDDGPRPPLLACRGRLASLSQPPGYLVEAQSVTSNPCEDLSHDPRLLGNRLESGRTTALLRTHVAISERSTRHH